MTMQKMAARAALAVGLAAAGWGMASTARTPAAGASTGPAHVSLAASRAARPASSQDRIFMKQATQINLTEIALGRYMQAHATTATTTHLGATYARDHAAAQASLRALAARLRVRLPTMPGVQLGSLAARVEAAQGRSRDVPRVCCVEAVVLGRQNGIGPGGGD